MRAPESDEETCKWLTEELSSAPEALVFSGHSCGGVQILAYAGSGGNCGTSASGLP